VSHSLPLRFTPAERDVQRQLGQGKSPASIAKDLDVRVSTIRLMIANMKQKSGSATVRELISFFPIDLNPSLPVEYRSQGFSGALDPDLAFYRLLGRGQPGTVCKRSGCKDAVVKYSVLCREHHFEVITRRPCPFHGDA
jgi:DNA-binding CsgD family transcriptional regulator